MEKNNDEAMGTPRHNAHPKVHSKMCKELTLMLDKVSSILPSIEDAQPGCKAGVDELCNLYNIVDKGKLIIQNCVECSSLYLAITSEATTMRCERIRNSLRRSLFLIQNMVEQLLADEVADVHNDLRDLKFIADPAEEDAGKVILEMLRHSEVSEQTELQTFLEAASKLNITSPKAVLIERRAIKKLLAKINGTDHKKEGILKYLLYLVRKYGKNVKPETDEKNQNLNVATEVLSLDSVVNVINTAEICISATESANMIYDGQSSLSGATTPPQELCCPLSLKLMRDPVIITSGQTYERENIERWFSEGYDTCPRTNMKLKNFTVTPNTCMKAVIHNWLKDHELESTDLPKQFQNYYSVSSLHNISAPLIIEKNRDYTVDYSSSSFGLSGASYISSPMRETEQSKTSFDQFYSNANFQLYLSFCNFDKAMFLGFFHELSELPFELQRKAVRDLKTSLSGENEIWHSMVYNGFFEAFHEFLKNDSGIHTLQARRAGIQFFLAFLSSGRARIPSVCEDVVLLIASLHDSEFKQEALLIVHELLQEPSCPKSSLMASILSPSVFGALDSGETKCLDLALQIICKISSDNDIKSYLLSSGIVSRLSPLLGEGKMTECSLKILRNLSDVKETAGFIIRTGNCVSSISDHLDTGSHSEREHAVVILLGVCSHSPEVCSLSMKEGVIPALVDLSVSGTKVARDCSVKLLQLLRNFRRCDQFSSSCSRELAVDHVSENTRNGSICMQPISKSARYISRKLNLFSKPRSLTLA
ncbi:U-box domain-containing protein 6 isoform X1 [Zea mays]|uniref:RING-type E3 ubiquitin transferase n=3 Tax=Zea mays TaxID=4577 RepID=K7VD57_MAIZE|nr:U-box domain-containing protein 6 isoform X1 [Zea mays]AQL03564.1 U-box domain-containing protein 5 [Zea mays]|eukprot:XP_008659543.1 U-box domain-containing protein 6 isoform X1 [Zea mays]